MQEHGLHCYLAHNGRDVYAAATPDEALFLARRMRALSPDFGSSDQPGRFRQLRDLDGVRLKPVCIDGYELRSFTLRQAIRGLWVVGCRFPCWLGEVRISEDETTSESAEVAE